MILPLGVDLGQGYVLGRPAAAERWSPVAGARAVRSNA